MDSATRARLNARLAAQLKNTQKDFVRLTPYPARDVRAQAETAVRYYVD